MSNRDVQWFDLYRTADKRAKTMSNQVSAIGWTLMAGEEFRLLGKRCRATLEWPDGPPMDDERMRAWAAEMLAALAARRGEGIEVGT